MRTVIWAVGLVVAGVLAPLQMYWAMGAADMVPDPLPVDAAVRLISLQWAELARQWQAGALACGVCAVVLGQALAVEALPDGEVS